MVDSVNDKTVLSSAKHMSNLLDEYLVGQEEPKKNISILFLLFAYQLLTNKNSFRTNLLQIGPEYSGKTYIIDTISELLDIPLISIDCSNLTAVGFHGVDVLDALVSKIELQNLGKEPTAFLIFENFDLLARSHEASSNKNFNATTQRNILSILQGQSVICTSNLHQNVKISTKNLFCILNGRFNELKSITAYKKDLRKSILNFGILPEILNVITTISIFDKIDMTQLLKDPNFNTNLWHSSEAELIQSLLEDSDMPQLVGTEINSKWIIENSTKYKTKNMLLFNLFKEQLFNLEVDNDKIQKYFK